MATIVGPGEHSHMYSAHISIDGVVKNGQLPSTIGVHKSPNSPRPIGEARYRGRDGRGVAWWALTVRGNELPGLWVIIDKRFVQPK
jgi:hypothetical protein